jgi:hypothetical protein
LAEERRVPKDERPPRDITLHSEPANPYAGINGYLITNVIDPGYNAQGVSARKQLYSPLYFGMTAYVLTDSEGFKEVSALTSDEIAKYRGRQLFNSAEQAFPEATLDDFLPLPAAYDAVPKGPYLSYLEALTPIFNLQLPSLYAFGKYDPTTRTFTNLLEGGKQGQWRLTSFEMELKFMAHLRTLSPLALYDSVLVRRGSGQGEFYVTLNDGTVIPIGINPGTTLDDAYRINQYYSNVQGLLFSDQPHPSWPTTSTPITVRPIVSIMGIGKDALEQSWFVEWQTTTALPLSGIPWLNDHSQLPPFQIGGRTLKLQLATGPIVAGYTTIKFVLKDTTTGELLELDDQMLLSYLVTLPEKFKQGFPAPDVAAVLKSKGWPNKDVSAGNLEFALHSDGTYKVGLHQATGLISYKGQMYYITAAGAVCPFNSNKWDYVLFQEIKSYVDSLNITYDPKAALAEMAKEP